MKFILTVARITGVVVRERIPDRLNDQDVARAIAAAAQNYHISQISIGESQRSRWKTLFPTSLT